MEATYQLNESELTEQFLHGLKETFKGKRVTISVMAQGEHTLSREAFEAKIAAADAADHTYSLSMAELKELAVAAEADESYDVVAELEKHRVEK